MYWKIISAVATDPGRSMVSVVLRETEASPDIVTLGILVEDPTVARVSAAVQDMVDDHVAAWAAAAVQKAAEQQTQSLADLLVGVSSS